MVLSFRVSQSSLLSADRLAVWRHMTRMAGVNEELMPVFRMTFPSYAADLSLFERSMLGHHLFTSVLLLFGIFPIDLHFLRLEDLDDERGFDENSSSLLHSFWRHRRSLRDCEGGVEVTDEVTFSPRLAYLGYLVQPIVSFVFSHRHRQLVRKFGALNLGKD